MVRAGYARPGQTGWQLIESFEVDVILDFAYDLIRQDLSPEQQQELDENLAKMGAEEAPDRYVERVREDGTTVVVSEKRLEELRAKKRLTVNVGTHRRKE